MTDHRLSLLSGGGILANGLGLVGWIEKQDPAYLLGIAFGVAVLVIQIVFEFRKRRRYAVMDEEFHKAELRHQLDQQGIDSGSIPVLKPKDIG